MVSMIELLFLCIVVPLALMLSILDKNARIMVAFMMIGMFMCLMVSNINTMLWQLIDCDRWYITTTVTPITEEIIKALPVIFFGFVISDNRERLISISMAVGIGFAILENMAYFMNSNVQMTLILAIARGFGASLMHGITTSAVGLGISFVKKRKKLFYTGTYALLNVAIIYHATYNLLLQSLQYGAVFLPVITYIPFVILVIKSKKQVSADIKKSRA